MKEEEFKIAEKKYKCKDCLDFNNDTDCGHCNPEHEICGDFYLEENI